MKLKKSPLEGLEPSVLVLGGPRVTIAPQELLDCSVIK